MRDTLTREFGDYTVTSVYVSASAFVFGPKGEYACYLKYKAYEVDHQAGFRNEAECLSWATRAIEAHKEAIAVIEEAVRR